jgi:hypothetical protein
VVCRKLRSSIRGLDHVLQAPCRIGLVADEDDGLDAGLFALVDFENQIDAIVRPLDDLRHDLDVEAAVALIDFDDALNVGLHRRARQRAALLRLDFLLELLVLHPVLPSKASRLMTGASTTVTTSLPPDWVMRTSWNRPEA